MAKRVVEALPDLAATWMTERRIAAAPLRLGAAQRLLGAELDLLVYDAHSGFDPDGFGAATGAIRAGGLLLLLTPPFDIWPDRPDPQAAGLAVWPHRLDTVGHRFIRRLIRILNTAPGLLVAAQRDAPCGPPAPAMPPARRHSSMETPAGALIETQRPADAVERDLGQPATPDQAEAVVRILAVAHGRAHRPLVILAHRGRGKSAALGLAARALLRTGVSRILVSAPRRSAVDALFKHAGEHPGLHYYPPADLVADPTPADLLLVDEAAGIPAPLLAALLQRFPRIVFASTVHGYEGTGRGFEVRFRDTLAQRTPRWQQISLETPIRWASGDPLEALSFRALLLDATPADAELLAATTPVASAAPAAPDPDPSGPTLEGIDSLGRVESGKPVGPCEDVERIRRDTLVHDECLLRELFGLLVLAHYQTRPTDLRILLDGPDVRLHTVKRAGHVAATLLSSAEGPLPDPALREAIFAGERRPRGHLLPQTLSFHAGLHEATALRYRRVVRIAVHPACTRQGLARRLLEQLAQEGRAEGLDMLGTSFGATPDLIRFWDHCGFRPAQLGTHRNAASAEHALVMLRPLSQAGQALAEAAETRLEARLPVLLAGPLEGVDPFTLSALAASLRAAPRATTDGPDSLLDPDGQRELEAFANAHRGLDATLPLLSELARARVGPALRAGRMTQHDAALLIASARQLRPISALVTAFAMPGRAELLSRLRRIVAMLATEDR